MKLNTLLHNLPIIENYGRSDMEVISINDDSRLIKKGGLFVAIRGLTVDGHKFISQAIERGARVVVGETKPSSDWIKETVFVQVKDSRRALGQIASNWYGNPSNKLKVIGVTGTKGKTTTAHMIYHILDMLGKKAGLISSITYPGLHVTTPGCIEIHKSLKKMVDEGKKHAVIEVSSHGIDQRRIAGIEFDIGTLTNILPEHLDYHKNFKDYKKTKMNFLRSCKKKIICPEETEVNTFPGRFNNLNAELALRVTYALGIERQKALGVLYSFKLPKGRLEEIINKRGFRIFIDFAHTPNSLEQVLKYLKSITEGKLIAIFGCAGERDTKKRPVMGKISAKIADISIFTAEDPRSEDINDILDQMCVGIGKEAFEIDKERFDVLIHRNKKGSLISHKFLKISERGEAISFAIQKLAKNGDTVVVLGKGHEKSMAYDGIEYPWSDHEAVKVALKGRIKKIERQ